MGFHVVPPLTGMTGFSMARKMYKTPKLNASTLEKAIL